MRCFHKSIRSFASLAIAASASTVLLEGAGPVDPQAVEGALRPAIQAAVISRLGSTANVSIAAVSGARLLADPGPLMATPDPSARIGKPSRFVLTDVSPGRPAARVGEATVTVNVTVEVVQARRSIPRGTPLEADDVVVALASLAGRPFRPLPGLEEAVGARATRDLGAESLITRADIVPRLLVRAGDPVCARVRVADVELTGTVVAVENGRRNDVIRVMNQETRHVIRARVVGTGEVEVVNVR